MPKQTACTFTNNISIKHKMSLLDGDSVVGNQKIKATAIMIHSTGRLLKILIKLQTYFSCPEKALNIVR